MPAAMPAAVTTTMSTVAAVPTTVVAAVLHKDMAETVSQRLMMLHLDYLVRGGDRVGRQRRRDTRGEAGSQYDGCGNRG